MKNSSRSSKYYWLMIALFVVSSFMVTTLSNAQGPGYGKGPGQDQKTEGYEKGGFCQNLPDLTADQEKKIEALRTKFFKEMLAINNLIDLKEAELNVLTTAEKADMKAIDAKIDEISALKANLAKKKEAHKQDVRALLTEDQRVIFDMHSAKKGGCHGGHQKPGGPGYGQSNNPNCPNK